MLWCLLQPTGYTESGELGGDAGEVHVTCAYMKCVGKQRWSNSAIECTEQEGPSCYSGAHYSL